MSVFFQHSIKDKNGIALLIAVILLAAFLSISLGILNLLLGQVVIGIQESASFHAFYAADIGMERTLYRDRVKNECGGAGDCSTGGAFVDVPYDGCYKVEIDTSFYCDVSGQRCITVTGRYNCSGGTRYVDRTFSIRY